MDILCGLFLKVVFGLSSGRRCVAAGRYEAAVVISLSLATNREQFRRMKSSTLYALASFMCYCRRLVELLLHVIRPVELCSFKDSLRLIHMPLVRPFDHNRNCFRIRLLCNVFLNKVCRSLVIHLVCRHWLKMTQRFLETQTRYLIMLATSISQYRFRSLK